MPVEAFAQSLGVAADDLVRRSYEARFPDRHRVAPPPRRGLAFFRALDEPKTRWVDGTPASTPYTNLLAMMFPEARFIHLIRDPEAVVLSWMGFSSRDPGLSKAEDLLTHIYHSQRTGYLGEVALGPDRCLRVMFDDMVGRPEPVLRRICDFIGEDYAEAMAEPLAQKINSTGGTSDAVRREFAGVAGHALLDRLRGWFRQAADPAWQIAGQAEAKAELDRYATFRLPLPPG
ncbi:MAG: sulfotransferase [Paracoccaceae bacterium]